MDRNKSVQCKYCDRQFFEGPSLTSHIKEKHNTENMFMNEINNLYQHLLRMNLPDIFQIKISPHYYYACNICPESSVTQFSHVVMDHIAEEHNSDEKALDIFFKQSAFFQHEIPQETIEIELVGKPKTFAFGCALCPHKMLFTTEEAIRHVNTSHGNLDDCMMLISLYQLDSLQVSDIDGSVYVKCLCNIALFKCRITNNPTIASLIHEHFQKSHLPTPENLEVALMELFKSSAVHTNYHFCPKKPIANSHAPKIITSISKKKRAQFDKFASRCKYILRCLICDNDKCYVNTFRIKQHFNSLHGSLQNQFVERFYRVRYFVHLIEMYHHQVNTEKIEVAINKTIPDRYVCLLCPHELLYTDKMINDHLLTHGRDKKLSVLITPLVKRSKSKGCTCRSFSFEQNKLYDPTIKQLLFYYDKKISKSCPELNKHFLIKNNIYLKKLESLLLKYYIYSFKNHNHYLFKSIREGRPQVIEEEDVGVSDEDDRE